MGDGIYLRGDTGGAGATQLYRITLRDCYCHTNNRLGIAVCGGQDITVDNCFMNSNSGTNPQGGIDIEPSAGETITNVIVKNCTAASNTRNGFQVNNPLSCTLTDVKFIGCRSISNGRYGWECVNMTGPLTIDGCSAASTGSTTGVKLTSTLTALNQIIVSNCVLDKPIWVSATTGLANQEITIKGNNVNEIDIDDATYVNVIGNQTGYISITYAAKTDSFSNICGNTVSTDIAAGGYGILLENCNKAIVTGNMVKGTTYGIYIVTDGDYNIIAGNQIFSTTNGGILISAGDSNLVSGNYLFDCDTTNATAAIYLVDCNTNTVQHNFVLGLAATGHTTDCVWLRNVGAAPSKNEIVYNFLDNANYDADIDDDGAGTVTTGNRNPT
jgi:parallel beta-helix repeat protein